MKEKRFLYQEACRFGKEGSTINFYPVLKKIGISATATIMLGFLLDCAKEISDHDIWLGITSAELEHATSLTIYEQRGARKHLISLGFLEEKRTGPSATLHFKIKFQALLPKLEKYL